LRAGAQRYHAQPLSTNNILKDKLLASLPFKPTSAQARVVAEIGIQTNASFSLMLLLESFRAGGGDISKLRLWCSFHPSQITAER
ncbi:hypothetical protein ONO84_24880, partial [Salmonella enterica subsp. enterica serovar Virginia]|nr:hypothetical protein [Salmonella enterica subsp. enterica serovar Virginia]